MIRRACKEIWADKLLIILSLAACLAAEYALCVVQINGNLRKPCILDAFAWCSKIMQSSIYIIVMLLIISMNKDNYRSERVVRQRYMESLWLYCMVKTGILSALFSVYVFFTTLIFGRCLSAELCNWNEKNSYYYLSMGDVITNVNYGMIFFTYTVGTFLGICVSALLVLLVQWFFGSYFFGAAVTIALNLMGDTQGYAYDAKRDVFFYNISYGIDIRYQFIYPCVIIALFCLIGLAKKRKDFLGKKEA